MNSRWLCISLLIVLFLAVFHNTVTNMAGFYIVSDLGGSLKTSVYPMVFYGLGNLLSLPTALPFSEKIGKKNLLVVSLILFALFSWLCSKAPTFFAFNLLRFFEGFSAGPFYLLCKDCIQKIAKEKEIATYSFLFILIFSIVPVVGACFGAWVAYDGRWQWIFFLSPPIALWLAFYFWKHFPPMPKTHLLCFDWVGYLFFCIGAIGIVTGLTMAEELDWFRSSLFTSLLSIGILCSGFFLLWSRYHPTPLFPFSLLKSPRLSFSLLNLAFLFSTYFGMIFLIALWLNIYVNYTPLWIALLLATMALAGILAYPIGHFLLKKFDPRICLGLAICLILASCYASTFFDVEVDFFHLAVARFLAGIGLILFLYPLFAMTLSSYGPEHSNQTFTLFQATRLLSSNLGAALYVILWHRRQIFFHERLGEQITPFSEISLAYFERAQAHFSLSPPQAKEILENLLTSQATSLALNDAFGFMGYLLLGLFILLLVSWKFPQLIAHKKRL